MIRPSSPPPPPLQPHPALQRPASPGEPTAYGKPFWLAYAATTLVMVAIALLFRYADFVNLLGGSELHLGWIVGVGMVGSLAMRLMLGLGIDHYGPRRVWLASLVLFSLTCFLHPTITTCTGPAIYLLRIAFCCAIAGIFGASMTFVSGRASPARMAEMIGMLGTAGFLGMVLGTQLGDLLLGTATIERVQIERMFFVAGVLGVGSAAFVSLATRGQTRPLPLPKRPSLLKALRCYNPGMVLLVGVAMGIGLGLPGTFLRAFAADLGIPRIGLFFAVYAPAAFITRILTRRLPERFGTTPMILAGLGALVISQLLLALVATEWQFVVPALGYGIAHALLFPSVVAAGNRTFPEQHRGLGTTLMLGTWDAGQLVGAPLAGAILHYSGSVGLLPYPTMFTVVATLLAMVGIAYFWRARAAKPPESVTRTPQETPVCQPVTSPPTDGNSRSSDADLPQSRPAVRS